MVMRVYATPSDYDEVAESPWDRTDDANDPETARLAKRLRSASIEIEGIVRLAVYDTDDDGYPTDQDTAEAFMEATCAVVEYWDVEDDPTGAEANVGAVKIGSVSVGTTSTRTDGVTPTLESRIGSRAVTILRNAGLLSAAVAHN